MEVGEVLARSVDDGPGDALVVGRLLGCFHGYSVAHFGTIASLRVDLSAVLTCCTPRT
jgi:hypothetical protein